MVTRKFKKTFSKKSGYSLVEMLVTLAITSIILVALVSLVATILRVSAITHARAITRENSASFTQFFERDLRNATRIGDCGGIVLSDVGTGTSEFNRGNNSTASNQFRCEIFTEREIVVWETCTRNTSRITLCENNPQLCNFNNQTETICRFLPQANNGAGVIDYKFDDLFNIDALIVNRIASDLEATPTDSTSSAEFSQNVVSVTIVTSHPNENLEINNIVRQSLLSTKNYDPVLN